jgi:hypothetical protein
LIDDYGAEFDWPEITRTLIETIPWQVETARIFGREMLIPRMTAWFGDGAYSYSGILHLPAAFPAIIDRLRERAEALSGAPFNAALANLYRSGRDSVGWHSMGGVCMNFPASEIGCQTLPDNGSFHRCVTVPAASAVC